MRPSREQGRAAGQAADPGRTVNRVLVDRRRGGDPAGAAINLAAREYHVSTAADGASGLAAIARDRPDVVILDLGLPDMDGTEVIRGVRGWTNTPIIVLSARGQESQKVAALDAAPTITSPSRSAWANCSPGCGPRFGGLPGAPDEPVVTTDDFIVDLAAKRVTSDRPTTSG